MLESALPERVDSTVASSVCIMGETSEETLTVSDVFPTFSLVSILAIWSISSMKGPTDDVWKPGAVAVILYCPMGRNWIL